MKKALVLLSSVAVVGLAGSAVAADLPARMPTKAPAAMPAAYYNWSGFYVGGNIGYGWGQSDTDSYNSAGTLVASATTDRDGIFGGGQIGVNWMLAPRWLVGIEADFNAADFSFDTAACTTGVPNGCVSTSGATDWFGTVRGRIGYAFDNWLIYGTGGAAWVHGHSDRTITCLNPAGTCPVPGLTAPPVGQTASSSGTHLGWTAGGGIEWGLDPNWSVKVEYLYISWDSSSDYNYSLTPTGTSVDRHNESDIHVNTVRVGVNYRFNWPQ